MIANNEMEGARVRSCGVVPGYVAYLPGRTGGAWMFRPRFETGVSRTHVRNVTA